MAHATNFKPAKGTAFMERRDRRKEVVALEDEEKKKVRFRDVTCRWPSCEYCRRYKNLTLHVAHINDKGMGGDHGVRSTADQMILLCSLRHEGGFSIHSGDCKVVPITDKGTNGPCQFEINDEQRGWSVIHVEDPSR